MNEEHLGGRKHICQACSITISQRCAFYNADKSLTRYAFSCGYVEWKGSKNLSMEHGVFHVKGTNAQGEQVWESFNQLTEARRFLRQA